MGSDISPNFFVSLFKKTINEKRFWQTECKKLRTRAAGLSMTITELRKSLDEEMEVRVNAEKELKVLRQEALKWRLARQNHRLIKRINCGERLKKLVRDVNKTLEQDLLELRKKRAKSSFAMFGFKRKPSEQEEVRQLKIDKNILLLELESLTLQNALQEKNIIQLEMQLNQVETNHTEDGSQLDEELEHLEENDNIIPSPIIDNSNSNCNRRQCGVIKQDKSNPNLSYEAAEAFDKVLSEKSGLGIHSSCFHENKSAGLQLDEFDPLLLANSKL